MCRMRRFLAVLRCFFHSSLLCTFPCHPSPSTILPSSLTSSCHLFLGLSLNLVVPKFIHNTLLGILFSSILCTCSNQHNLFNLIVNISTVSENHCKHFLFPPCMPYLKLTEIINSHTLEQQGPTKWITLLERQHKVICFSQTQQYSIIFNLMATSFGHQTIIRPPLHAI